MTSESESEATISHDGSFPGFLCACADALNTPAPPPRVLRADRPEELFETRFTATRDDERAASLWQRMTRLVGTKAMRCLLEAFLSDSPDADSCIATVIRRLRFEGAQVMNDLSDPVILAVEKAAHRSRAEAHLLTGLVRFSELSDGCWYAAIRPSSDVLMLIADHFCSRFEPMRFVIHDSTRGTAILHEPGQSWSIPEGFSLGSDDLLKAFSDRENTIRNLWRCYFQSTAIQERLNPSLQASRMPKRYWSLLVEMEEPTCQGVS